MTSRSLGQMEWLEESRWNPNSSLRTRKVWVTFFFSRGNFPIKEIGVWLGGSFELESTSFTRDFFGESWWLPGRSGGMLKNGTYCFGPQTEFWEWVSIPFSGNVRILDTLSERMYISRDNSFLCFPHESFYFHMLHPGSKYWETRPCGRRLKH